MRVKLLIALAIASIILLASSLPAWAVEGITGPSGTRISVGTPFVAPPVIPTIVTPGSAVAFTAPVIAPVGLAAPITLGGPALAATIRLSPPQVPSFISPTFALPSVVGPRISPFIARAPAFDP